MAFHLGAIIYHICETVSLLNLNGGGITFPNQICFTGQGSKYISLLHPEGNGIKNIIISIINAYLQNNQNNGNAAAEPGFNFNRGVNGANFNVYFSNTPKELTAIGALCNNVGGDITNIINYDGTNICQAEGNHQTYGTLFNDDANNILMNDNDRPALYQSYNKFIDVVFGAFYPNVNRPLYGQLDGIQNPAYSRTIVRANANRVEVELPDITTVAGQYLSGYVNRALESEGYNNLGNAYNLVINETMFFWGVKLWLRQLAKDLQ